MDVPTLNMLLRSIITVTTVWNTGETGDTNIPSAYRIGLRFRVLAWARLGRARQFDSHMFGSDDQEKPDDESKSRDQTTRNNERQGPVVLHEKSLNKNQKGILNLMTKKKY